MQSLSDFIGRVVQLFIAPLVGLLFAVALVYFVWGAAQFILKADDAKARETGKQHLIWSIVGLFIMVGVIGILSIVTNTFCDTTFCR